MIQYSYDWVILCTVGEVIIFKHGCYISALKHIIMLISSNYVPIACINTIYKCVFLGDLVRCTCILSFNFGLRSSTSEVCSYLRHKYKLLILSRLSDIMISSERFNI